MALGFLHTDSGIFYSDTIGSGLNFLFVQGVGVVTICSWAFIVTFICTKIINAISSIRVSKEDEFAGLDCTEHGATLYPDFNIRTL